MRGLLFMNKSKFLCSSRKKKNNLHFILCIRFSSEVPSFAFPEKKPKATSSFRDRRGSDWLGLKLDDDFRAADATNTKTPVESPLLKKRSSPADNHVTSTEALAPPSPTDEAVDDTKQQASKSQLKEEDKDDWLAGMLRKKALPQAPFSERRPPSADGHVGSVPAAKPSLTQTHNTAKEVEPEASTKQQEDDWLGAALRRKSRFKAEGSGLRQDQGSPVRWGGFTTVSQMLVRLHGLIAFF